MRQFGVVQNLLVIVVHNHEAMLAGSEAWYPLLLQGEDVWLDQRLLIQRPVHLQHLLELVIENRIELAVEDLRPFRIPNRKQAPGQARPSMLPRAEIGELRDLVLLELAALIEQLVLGGGRLQLGLVKVLLIEDEGVVAGIVGKAA
jgi:hypothetical protein